MNVSAPFIWRPIATSLLGVAVLLGGLLGYFNLPISALPQVDFPTIQVTTQLPGANAQTTSSLLTAPLERQFGQIPSLQLMTSTSSFGISQITLQFDLDRDIDGAAQDVQAAINSAGSALPRNLPYPPIYSKVNPADTPIITLALTSDTVPIRDLSNIADTLLAQRLSEMTGVGKVTVQGGLKPAVRIRVDMNRLSAYGLGSQTLRTAITNASVAGPKGALDGTHQFYTINANDQLTSADAYRNVVLAYRNGAPVLLSDVADIIDGLENNRVASWYQGKPAVVLDIQRQPGFNVVQTVARIRAEIPRLQSVLPKDAHLTIVSDRTGTISASIHDVQFTLVLSVALVVLVVLLFLRSVAATIIAGTALPLSLIATFGVMWFFGFSLDNLSLMALTIGTGFVVDDAIVIIENIVRHIEKGEKPFAAALQGSKEIGFTVISLTVSLIAVFIPLLFMSDLVGRMFREFALTLTIAVIVSAIVSLTLTPMMSSRLLRSGHASESSVLGKILGFFDAQMERALTGYEKTLRWALQRGRLMLGLTLGTLIATIVLYTFMPKGFLPQQDTGMITVVTQASPTISFQEMSRLQLEVSAVLEGDADVAAVVAVAGVSTTNPAPNVGNLSVFLTARDKRNASVQQIIARLKQKTSSIAGVSVYYQPVQDIQISTQSSRAQYQYQIIGANADEVSRWVNSLVAQMRQARILQDVSLEDQEGGLLTNIDVNRELAGQFGVSMQNVSDTLNDAFGQRQIATIYGQANQYRVVLEATPRLGTTPSTLRDLKILSATGAQVPLNSFATITETTTPLTVGHNGQFPSMTISFNLSPGTALDEAVRHVRAIETEIGMPTSLMGTYAGDAAEFNKSLANEVWLILAATVTIYIVLGMLYESYIHPLTILSTLPSAGLGALLALVIFGLPLSVISLIGIILLMGIVKKNAIMMIDFALDAERNQGMTPEDAIFQACLLRFRPIMMTTLAALFGAIPLAFGTGTGSELRFPLGVTIIGGLLLSQLLTLYTTPVIYLGLEHLRLRFVTWRGTGKHLEPDEG